MIIKNIISNQLFIQLENFFVSNIFALWIKVILSIFVESWMVFSLFNLCLITSRPASSKMKIYYLCLPEPLQEIYCFPCDENECPPLPAHDTNTIITGDFQSHSLMWYVNARTKFHLVRSSIFILCYTRLLPPYKLLTYRSLYYI